MIYILVGEDDFSLRRSLEEIKNGLGDPSLLAANTTTLEGQSLTVDQLRLACETMPFLADRRLVIIEGLLGRFEPPKTKPRRKKSPSTPIPQHDHKPFREIINKTPESTVLILIDGEIGKANPLLAELTARAEVKTFPRLNDPDLRRWIQRQVQQEDRSISPEAVELLIKLIGGDLWVMANELRKLSLFAGGRRIEEADVKALVSFARESSVFTMVDAALGFNAPLAERSLQQLLQSGAAAPYLLSMLSRQLRLIVRAKELKKQGLPDFEIQKRLGLAEFALRKTLEQASKYSWERLKQMYGRLLEADLAIKTGRYEDELALNLLVADLCQR